MEDYSQPSTKMKEEKEKQELGVNYEMEKECEKALNKKVQNI
jgi:hypothetical protein